MQGATTAARCRTNNRDFNPRSLCRERLLTKLIIVSGVISIHAPYAGSDDGANVEITKRIKFQSTLPMQGATVLSVPSNAVKSISIHAPYAGSDER